MFMLGKIQSKIILLILTVIGAFFRIYNLFFQCIWTEEQYTLTISKLPFIQILTQSLMSDFNPPLYYFAAHVSLLLSGFTDVSIRYPSVICGILIIPAMYILGETYKDELTGLYCAGFATILFPLIYYAQYARAYEMSVLFFIIALILYVRIKRSADFRIELAFWVVAALNIWIHLFAIIPVGLMVIDLLIFDSTETRWVLAGLMGAVTSPLLIPLLLIPVRRAVSAGVSYGASPIQMVVLTPVEFFNTLFLNFIVLATVGFYFDKSAIKNRFIVITIVTFVVGVICSNFTPFFPRYYMTISMILVLMAAVACSDLTKILSEKLRITGLEIPVFVVVIVIFLLMEMSNFSSHYFIQQYVC